MRWYYRIEAENQEIFRDVRPPYLVIPNHVMTWDPLIVSFHNRDPIHFVASDANFRSSLASWWLRRFGAIAKSKLRDDFGALRTVMRLVRAGRVVGVFGEGERTWDGVTLPLIPSTAKLVKAAQVPVIVPVLKGAYLSLPRWAFRSRRGRIAVEYRLALSREEILRMDVGEIRLRLEQAMFHDEDEYQKTRQVVYTSQRAAEPMQLLLFYCPQCASLNRMKSERRRLFCTSCGYSVRFSGRGRFLPDPEGGRVPVVHATIGEWARDQERFVDAYLAQRAAAASVLRTAAATHNAGIEEPLGEEIFRDEPVSLSTGYRMVRPARRAVGRLSLHLHGLSFCSPGGEVQSFRWQSIRGLNVVYQDQIEFYYSRRLIVFEFPRHDTSGYKYLLCGRTLTRWGM